MSLSVNKLIRCLYPLRQLYHEKTTLIKLTAFLYSLTILQTIYMFSLTAMDKTVVEFLSTQSYCTMVSSYNPNKMWLFEILYHVIYNIMPLLILLLSDIFLVIIAVNKAYSRVKMSSIIFILLVSATFIGCYFPYTITRFMLHFNAKSVSGKVLTIAYFLHMSAYWLNPPIYLLTNPRFRKFTIKLVLTWRADFSSSKSSVSPSNEYKGTRPKRFMHTFNRRIFNDSTHKSKFAPFLVIVGSHKTKISESPNEKMMF